jgi:hypothetical protein
MKNLNNHKMLLIDAGVDNYPAEGTVFSDSIAAGVVAMVDEESKVLTSATSNISTSAKYERVRFVQSQGAGKPLIMSAPVKRSTVAAYGKRYTAATQQVSYIGYDGTSYALALPATGTSIIVRNTFNTMFTQFSDKLMESIVGYKYNSATDTVATVAAALTKAMILDVEKYVNLPYKVERTSNGTLSDFTGTGTLVKVTKGSKTVRAYVKDASQDAGVTASTFTTAVGDVWNFPSTSGRTFTFSANASGSTAGANVVYIGNETFYVADAGDATANGTAIAAAINAGSSQATATAATGTVTITYNPSYSGLPPVAAYDTTDGGAYTFIAVTVASGNAVPVKYLASTAASAAASFDLDVAWQGETGYIVGGTTAASMTGTMATITSWGIKLTGLPQKRFQEGVFRYETSKWTTTAQNFSTTVISDKATAPTEGIGTYEQVAEEEWFFQLLEGAFDQNTIQIPPVTWRKNVQFTGKYSIVDLEWSDVAGGTDILHNPVNFKQLRLAVNLATRVSGNKLDDICDAIEAWAPSTAAIVPTT